MPRNLAEAETIADKVQPQTVEIANHVINACADAKGENIVVLDVSKISDLAKYFIIVSGRSDRQVQGLANRICLTLDQSQVKSFSIEGLQQGHWVLIDCDDVVVHVFYEPIRAHYDLESLWIKAKRVELKARKTREGQSLSI